MPSSWFPKSSVTPLRGGPVLRWGIVAPGVIADYFATTVLANTDQRSSRWRRAPPSEAPRSPSATASSAATLRTISCSPTLRSTSSTSPRRTASIKRSAWLAIAAGKHVLIEKPLALSAAEAEEIAAAARVRRGAGGRGDVDPLPPPVRRAEPILERGDLGTIRLATADVGWQMGADAPPRFFDPAQGGGAALDMGVYGYWFAQFAIGRPQRVRALGSLTAPASTTRRSWPSRRRTAGFASVTTSMAVTNSGLAAIHGTAGTARFLEPFVFPARFVVEVGGDSHEWHDTSGLTMRDGLAWQTTALADFIAQG